MKILVTGAAGFIGYHTARRLLERGDEVVGLDNVNDYYDVNLKKARLEHLQDQPGFSFHKVDIADASAFTEVYQSTAPQRVIHLAAQAGVRYSLDNPHAYVDANITGFLNVLEAARHFGCGHLVFASTSSVYGSHTNMPFSVHDGVDHPVSLYAASKKANELMAHTYSHLYGLPTTGLRFFTVYGPWGRPDMALFTFTRNILEGRPIPVFNHGHHTRDFTYIDDIAEGVIRASDQPAAADPKWDPQAPNPATSRAPWRLFNIGNTSPVQLLDYIRAIEDALGMTAKLDLLPAQPGDVADTFADVTALESSVGYRPDTAMTEGVRRFVEWYRGFYRV